MDFRDSSFQKHRCYLQDLISLSFHVSVSLNFSHGGPQQLQAYMNLTDSNCHGKRVIFDDFDEIDDSPTFSHPHIPEPITLSKEIEYSYW